MKRIFLLIVAFVSLNSAMAQSSDVKRVIKKYDVVNVIKDVTFYNASSFWFAVRNENKRVKEIDEAYKKGKRSLNEALYYVNQNLDDYSRFSNLSAYDDSLNLWLSRRLGIDIVARNKPIKIFWSNAFNASMDPTGQMLIYRGLLNYLTYKEILAVCAHEMAHFVCAHHVSEIWKVVKKTRRNREWAKVGVSLAVGAMAASSAYAGSNGVDVTSMNNMIANSNIFFQSASNYADGATLRYQYRYSRDEEIECDIIAYRFMEAMGYGPEHWISAMQKMLNIMGDYRTNADKYDDHPTTSFRLQVLKAMQSGYSGK